MIPINTTRKGNKVQRKALNILESQGYITHLSVRTSVRRRDMWVSQSNDIFNAFDIIATRMGERPRFIQATTMSNVSNRIKKVKDIPLDITFASVEIWGWKGGRRRLDRRYKDSKVWIETQYFQLYRKDNDFVLIDGDIEIKKRR